MYRGFTLGRSPANMLHLKPFNFNYTIGTGTHFLEMLAEARALRSAGQVFSATLDRDQTNPAGRVIFKPRNGYSQDTALQTKDALGAGFLLQVPGSLLDALDPRARIEFPTDSAAKTDAISRRYPQRKLIRKEELANDFSSPEWNDVKYLLEAKLDLVELSLATGSVPGPGKLYEFRLSGNWHSTDLPFVTSALGAANADSTAAIWVQQAVAGGGPNNQEFLPEGNGSRVEGGRPGTSDPDRLRQGRDSGWTAAGYQTARSQAR
jgi:hypothetical protein